MQENDTAQRDATEPPPTSSSTSSRTESDENALASAVDAANVDETNASVVAAVETPLVNGETKPNVDGGGGGGAGPTSGHPYDNASPEGATTVLHGSGDDDERNEKRGGIARTKPPTNKLRFTNASRQVKGLGLYPGRPAGPINVAWQQQQQQQQQHQQQHNWQQYMQNQQRIGYMTQYPYAASASPYMWRGIAQPPAGGAVSSMYPVMRPSMQHHTTAHQQPEQLSTTNIYIRALSPTTTDHDLQQMCQEFGDISSVKAIINKSTGDCKGYGFVDFASADDARKALEQLKTRKVQAQFAKLTPNDPRWKRLQETDPTNLYIQNLPKYLDEKGLESMLAPFGKVVSTRILKEQGSSFSKGVGFARMSAQSECEAIISKFNGIPITGSDQPLVCKFADAASARRRYHPDQRRLSGDGELGTQDPIISNRMAGGGGQGRPLQTPLMSYNVPGIPQGAYQMASGQASWIQSPQGYTTIPTSNVTVPSPGQESLTGSYPATAAMVPQLTAQMQHLQLSQTQLGQQVQQHQAQPIYMTVANPQHAGASYAHHQHAAAIQHQHQQPQHQHAHWPVAPAQTHSLIMQQQTEDGGIGLIHSGTSGQEASPQHSSAGASGAPTSEQHHLSHPIMQQSNISPTDGQATASVSQMFVEDASMGHHHPMPVQQYPYSASGQVPLPQHTAWPAT
ncbi:uncharacterized protein [Oscarella lobularis]|uniref:uncharacterized protein isoform X3 n=1 Tax=Oscarella lobularis TaxID=121494 RepID=UPI00331336EE